MDLGIELPNLGAHASEHALTQVAQGAEQLEYACVWVGERLLSPTTPKNGYGNQPGVPWPESQRVAYDPLETLSYVAAKTSRIRLGASVLTSLFQSPVGFAKRLATLDQLSGGRLIVGLGQGWSEDEFETANVPIKRRGAGYEEFISAVRAVWGPDPVQFTGRFYHVPESYIGPKPVQAGGPPILLGFINPIGIARAVQLANGINPVAVNWQLLEYTVGGYQQGLKIAGRDPSAYPVMLRSNNPITPDPMADPRPVLGGSIEQVRDDLQRVSSLGVSHVFFGGSATELPIEALLRRMERLRTLV